MWDLEISLPRSFFQPPNASTQVSPVSPCFPLTVPSSFASLISPLSPTLKPFSEIPVTKVMLYFLSVLRCHFWFSGLVFFFLFSLVMRQKPAQSDDPCLPKRGLWTGFDDKCGQLSAAESMCTRSLLSVDPRSWSREKPPDLRAPQAAVCRKHIR